MSDEKGALEAAKNALRLSEERLRSVLATTPDGIITINARGIVDSSQPVGGAPVRLPRG